MARDIIPPLIPPYTRKPMTGADWLALCESDRMDAARRKSMQSLAALVGIHNVERFVPVVAALAQDVITAAFDVSEDAIDAAIEHYRPDVARDFNAGLSAKQSAIRELRENGHDLRDDGTA